MHTILGYLPYNSPTITSWWHQLVSYLPPFKPPEKGLVTCLQLMHLRRIPGSYLSHIKYLVKVHMCRERTNILFVATYNTQTWQHQKKWNKTVGHHVTIGNKQLSCNCLGKGNDYNNNKTDVIERDRKQSWCCHWNSDLYSFQATFFLARNRE